MNGRCIYHTEFEEVPLRDWITSCAGGGWGWDKIVVSTLVFHCVNFVEFLIEIKPLIVWLKPGLQVL